MVPELTTKRLILCPLQLEDAAQTQLLFPHWEIVQHLNARVPWPYPPDGAFAYYRDVILPAVERNEEWHWTLRLQRDPALHIGSICLNRMSEENRGFWLGQAWQRQGLMREAVEAVTDYWFEVLGMPVLRTKKAVANLPSRKLSASLGMRLIGLEEYEFVAGRLPAEIWEITREEWDQFKKRRSADSDLF
jgi:ribosomal-protein-alanine N-acetyltransferase